MKSEIETADRRVTIGQYVGPLEVAAPLMDDAIRDRLHDSLPAGTTAQEFADAYCAEHEAVFGEKFRVAV